MKIVSFLQSLLPMLKKDSVLEDLRITKAELDKTVMPSYEAAAGHFKVNKIASKDTQALADTFYRIYDLAKSNKQSSVVAEIFSKLPNLSANIVTITNNCEDILGEDILNDNLSAKRAVLVRAAEHVSILVKLLVDFLTVVYYNEAMVYSKANADTIGLSAQTLKRVKEHVPYIARLLSTYGEDNKVFAGKYNSVPDVILNIKTAAALQAVYREDKLDPMPSALASNFEGNPIYHIRLVVAEWQANRYKANKDKKKMLELRLLYLQSLAEESPDPQLEREIEYIQNRIDKLEYEMHKATES